MSVINLQSVDNTCGVPQKSNRRPEKNV